MNNLRRLCAVVVLTVALSFSTLAGDILTPGITSQPQSSTTTSLASDEAYDSTQGDILTPGEALDPVTEATLNLLQSLLSIF